MSRRFVFVPIFGDVGIVGGDREAWLKAPHVKAWGFFDDEDKGAEFTPIHTDPPCKAIVLGESTDLFSDEREAAIEVPEDSTDLPDEVCLALAKLALLPVSRTN